MSEITEAQETIERELAQLQVMEGAGDVHGSEVDAFLRWLKAWAELQLAERVLENL